MTVLVERLKIAAQEAQRVSAKRRVKVGLKLEAAGVRVRGLFVAGPLGMTMKTHDYTVPWAEIEQSVRNPLVIQINATVAALDPPLTPVEP